MVVLVARTRIVPDHRAETYELFQAMLAPSQAEGGCISYEFYVSPDDPDYTVFVEEWESYEALQAHFETPHFLNFVAQTERFLEQSPDVRIYEVARMLGD